jgi:hypothetical protein
MASGVAVLSFDQPALRWILFSLQQMGTRTFCFCDGMCDTVQFCDEVVFVSILQQFGDAWPTKDMCREVLDVVNVLLGTVFVIPCIFWKTFRKISVSPTDGKEAFTYFKSMAISLKATTQSYF